MSVTAMCKRAKVRARGLRLCCDVRRHGFVHLSPFGRKFFNDLEMILVEDALRNDLRW